LDQTIFNLIKTLIKYQPYGRLSISFTQILTDKSIFSSFQELATFRREETIRKSATRIGSTNTNMSLPKLVRHQEHHCNPMGIICPKCKMASSSSITIIINIRTQDPIGDIVLMQSMVMYFLKLENKAVTNKEKPEVYYLKKILGIKDCGKRWRE